MALLVRRQARAKEPTKPASGLRVHRSLHASFTGPDMGGQRSIENGMHLVELKAAAMANHSSTRTMQLYDRRHDEVSLDEVERIVI
jgi:hypothetical protein